MVLIIGVDSVVVWLGFEFTCQTTTDTTCACPGVVKIPAATRWFIPIFDAVPILVTSMVLIIGVDSVVVWLGFEFTCQTTTDTTMRCACQGVVKIPAATRWFIPIFDAVPILV